MELVISKGMVIFLVIVLSLTIISSIGTKKYDRMNNVKEGTYLSYTNN